MPRQQIVSPRIGKPSGHFSQANAIEARGRFVFISGMTAKAADGSIVGRGRHRGADETDVREHQGGG